MATKQTSAKKETKTNVAKKTSTQKAKAATKKTDSHAKEKSYKSANVTRADDTAVQVAAMQEKYGRLLSEYTNLKLKINVMLGQMLKALFIVGIGPDELMAKCNEMFQRKTVEG